MKISQVRIVNAYFGRGEVLLLQNTYCPHYLMSQRPPRRSHYRDAEIKRQIENWDTEAKRSWQRRPLRSMGRGQEGSSRDENAHRRLELSSAESLTQVGSGATNAGGDDGEDGEDGEGRGGGKLFKRTSVRRPSVESKRDSISRYMSSKRSSKKRISRASRKTLEFAATYDPETAVQGYLKQRSTAGTGWHRRWFILHDHYLSYSKKRPRSQAEFLETVLGSINLWAVNQVEVEGCDMIISLRNRSRSSDSCVSAEDSVAGKSRWLARAYTMFSFSKDEVVLRAENEDTAQRWVQAMYSGPFAGQAQQAYDAEGSKMITNLSISAEDVERFGVEEEEEEEDCGLRDPGLAVHRLRVTMTRKATKSPLFESKRLFGTRIALGRVPPSARIQVDMCRIGKPVGMLASKPISTYPQLPNGAYRVAILDADMMLDGVIVQVRRDPLHALMSDLNSVTTSGLAIVSLSICMVCMLIVKSSFGIVLGFAIQAAILAFLLHQNQDAMILENIRIVSMQEALAVDLMAEQNSKLRRNSSSRGSMRRGSIRRESMLRGLGESSARSIAAEDLGDGVELTSVEESLLKEFRSRVSDLLNPRKVRDPYARELYRQYISEDFRLIRFLRARNLSLRKAEKFLRKSLQWRIDYGASEIHQHFTPPEWMMDYFGSDDILRRIRNHEDRLPWYFQDEENHLSLFLRIGRVDYRKTFIKLEEDGDLLFRCGVWLFEMLLQDLERHYELSGGRVAPQISLVLDMEGFQLSKQLPISTALSLARRYVGKLLDGYPEILANITIINAPWLFNSLWTMFQPFFPERVLSKIWIGGSNKRACQKRIRMVYNGNQTPVAYGGYLKEDEDLFCSSRVPCRGPYLEDEGASLLAGDDDSYGEFGPLNG